MWKFKHTMLTSEVMNEAERMYQDIAINDDQRNWIEHAAYVACMNKDTIPERIADFCRVLKIHHVTPAEITAAQQPQEAPAAEAEQQPTETAEAAQAAPAARQADDITAAMIDAIGADAPAQTVTVTWANGSRATYSAAMLDMLRTDPAALDIQDGTTGEIIYIKHTPTENAPQAATQAAEGTDEKKEAETMSRNATFTPAEAAMHAATARGIIRRKGGYRERDIINHPHTVERGTWTTEHKVVEILSTTPDPDGYRPGCAIDIVTRAIVG